MAVVDTPWDGSESRFTPEQWAASCLLDMGSGNGKERYKLPVKEPNGDVNRNACHAAAAVLGGGRGGVKAPDAAIASAKSKLRGLYDQLNEKPPPSLSGRSDDQEFLASRPCDPFARSYAIEDMHVRADGTGRIVEAYAAAFNSRAEIMDQDGHYFESLSPDSFNKTIAEKGTNFGVLFNHGRTIDGAPNPLASMPIGVPLEVTPDDRGVFTVTRYLDNPLANDTLDAIKQRAITAQSFSGMFIKSVKSYPDGRGRSALPTITRHEVKMREYGPAVFAAYGAAQILGTRAEQFVRALLQTPPDRRLDWLAQFEGFTTPSGPDIPIIGTSPEAAESTDEPREHSARSLASRIRVGRIARGIE
jgi:HK97 family phage prohead protease